MNRIEASVTNDAAELSPLHLTVPTTPVLTPVLAATVVGATVAFGVGSAEGKCVEDAGGSVSPTGELAHKSIGELLKARQGAL